MANEVKNISKKTLFRTAVGTTSLILGGVAFKKYANWAKNLSDQGLLTPGECFGLFMYFGVMPFVVPVMVTTVALVALTVMTTIATLAVKSTIVWVWNHLA